MRATCYWHLVFLVRANLEEPSSFLHREFAAFLSEIGVF